MPNIDFDIIQFFNSPLFRALFPVVKFGTMAFSAFLLFIIVFALLKTLYLKRLLFWDMQELISYQPLGARKILKDWQKIKDRLDTGLESDFKIAVIEADSILDDVLKKLGFTGESLGERLDRLTAASLPNLEDAKVAHKARNNIVHDPDYRLGRDEAAKVIQVIEESLAGLHAL